MFAKFKQKIAKLKDLDKYIIFSFTVLIIFTIVYTVIFCIKDSVPDTLITAFFGFFGGEIVCCAMIKRLKLKRGDET